MSKIIEIIGCHNKVSYAIVEVLLDDGMVGEVWIGGQVETYYHKGKIKCFVKRRLDS